MADVYAHVVKDIAGNEVKLEQYRGKVTLFVNVASRCGFTNQYADLEKLHAKFAGQPFAVLGFPSNDFGAQEPGTEAEIREFCSRTYGVSFPMFSKVKVRGEAAVPVYAALARAAGGPKWNFHKYLVGKDGAVIRGFESSVAPLGAELVATIEGAIGA